MKNLFAFEFRKLFRSKSFYILLFISLVPIIIQAFFLYTQSTGPEPWDEVVTAFSMLRDSASYSSTSLCFGIFIALFMLEDFNCGTIKVVYGRGYRRSAVFAVKFLIVELCVTLFFVATCGTNFICGLIFFKKGTAPARLAVTLLAQLAVFLAYGAVFFSFATLFKKTGGSIASVLLIPSVVQLLAAFGDSFVVKINKKWSITRYTLSNAIDELTVAGTVTSKTVLFSCLLALAYIVVFAVLSGILFRKRDV